MRDLDRIDRILNKIREEWRHFPDQRFGQFLVNVDSRFETEPFFLQDETLEQSLQEWEQKRVANTLGVFREIKDDPFDSTLFDLVRVGLESEDARIRELAEELDRQSGGSFKK